MKVQEEADNEGSSDEEENISIDVEEEADNEGSPSDASTEYSTKEIKKKDLFNEHYKGPNHFYPGHNFNYTIVDERLNKETLKWLNSILCRREDRITKSINQILNGKQFFIQKQRMILPCPFRHCFFRGINWLGICKLKPQNN